MMSRGGISGWSRPPTRKRLCSRLIISCAGSPKHLVVVRIAEIKPRAVLVREFLDLDECLAPPLTGARFGPAGLTGIAIGGFVFFIHGRNLNGVGACFT